MELETKFLRLPRPVEVGKQIDMDIFLGAVEEN